MSYTGGRSGQALHFDQDRSDRYGDFAQVPSSSSLNIDGNLTISGTLTTAGSCSVGCDQVFKSGYEIPSIEEHASFMRENSYLEAVGPTPENGAMNISEKMGGMLNELEKAHIYIEQLNEALKVKSAELESVKKRLASLERRL